MKQRWKRGAEKAFLVTGPIDGAHVARKKRRGAACPRGWFPDFRSNGFAGRRGCPRAPFAKRSRCQSQESADTSDIREKLQTRSYTGQTPRSWARPNSIKRFENACNRFPDCPWGALLLVAFFTRRKYHCRTMESCTPKRAACSFLLVRARLSLFYIQSNVRSGNASLNKAANVKMITVNAKYFVDKNWEISVNVELCR